MLNKKSLQKAFDIINAYWIVNHEYIEDEDDKEEVLNTLAYLSALIQKIETKKSRTHGEIRDVYAKEDDMTFIVCDEYVDGECVGSVVINWYYGEPDPEITTHFIEKVLMASN